MCNQCKNEQTSRFHSDAEEAYRRLALKHQQLSDFIYKYVSDTQGLQRSVLTLTNHHSDLKVLYRIINGVPTLEGEYNECCLIGTRNSNTTTNWCCTGVLIHPRIVLTAAHCIQPGKAYITALSTTNQNNLDHAEVINVRKATIHPEYYRTNLYNDIAVLVLQKEAKTPPVTIATSSEVSSAPEVTLVGFGNDDIESTRGFGIKRKVDVDIVSIRHNEDEDLNIDEATYGYESDLEFVAGGKGYDTCNGDSGGPAYIMVDNQRKVAGLTSRGRIPEDPSHRCGDGGIYTRLDVHASFINHFLTQPVN